MRPRDVARHERLRDVPERRAGGHRDAVRLRIELRQHVAGVVVEPFGLGVRRVRRERDRAADLDDHLRHRLPDPREELVVLVEVARALAGLRDRARGSAASWRRRCSSRPPPAPARPSVTGRSSTSPGSHSGPYGAAVMIVGCMFSGNSESSVKYILLSFYRVTQPQSEATSRSGGVNGFRSPSWRAAEPSPVVLGGVLARSSWVRMRFHSCCSLHRFSQGPHARADSTAGSKSVAMARVSTKPSAPDSIAAVRTLGSSWKLRTISFILGQCWRSRRSQ